MNTKTIDREYCFEYAVRLNQWSMRLLGLWPLDERFSTLKWSVGFIVALLFLFPSMAYMLTLADWELILEQAITTVPLCLILMKLSYVKGKAANFTIILKTMIDDWSKFHRLPEWAREIMIQYARTGRRLNVIFVTCMLISIFGYLTFPTRQKRLQDSLQNVTVRKLPTEGLYPFDPKKSPVYEILYSSQVIVSFLYCITTFSIDCFLAVIVFHACGQLSTLAKILKRYDTYTKHVQSKESSFCSCACLKCIVKRHVLVTKYMEIVEKSFNEFVLLQVLGNCFILAAEGYQLVTYAEESNAWGSLTFVVYIGTVTYNIFIYCYIGECIIQKSEEIGDVAYNLRWNDLPRNLSQPLILLMIRSRKSCKLTAGRFDIISLSYYRSILTTAISYISVLRAIR